ncbi:hypothetical protein [Streptococcus himalayensis]|nr:hypothetical protein [Streptococcus himalayensis]
MSKYKIMILCISLSFLIVCCVLVIFLKSSSLTDYQKAVQAYRRINMEELEARLEKNESIYLYIGRESCPYCREFVPKLTQAVSEKNSIVYYLDSEGNDKEAIKQFRKLQGIKTVPSLGYYNHRGLVRKLEKGSQASIEEIKEFLRRR